LNRCHWRNRITRYDLLENGANGIELKTYDAGLLKSYQIIVEFLMAL
jgi:hypothetical protein